MEGVWLEREETARSHHQQVQSPVFPMTCNFRHRFSGQPAWVSLSWCHTYMSLITQVKANLWETLIPSSRVQPWSPLLCFYGSFLGMELLWHRRARWTKPAGAQQTCVISICLCWRQVTPERWAVIQRSTAAGTARLHGPACFICLNIWSDQRINSHELLLSFPHTPRYCICCFLNQASHSRIFIWALTKRAVTLELFALRCASQLCAEAGRKRGQPSPRAALMTPQSNPTCSQHPVWCD